MEIAISRNLIDTITSMEVASMIEMSHKNLLRKLEGTHGNSSKKPMKGYIQILTERKIEPSKFFIPSSYQDSTGKNNKCYLITKFGCEFLSHKFTGERGVVFTARYIERFHEMEKALYDNIPTALPNQYRNTNKLPLKCESWGSRNYNSVQIIVDHFGSSFREFYHLFLKYVNRQGIDVDRLNFIFYKENGRNAKHTGELIDYFSELEEKADEYLRIILEEVREYSLISSYDGGPKRRKELPFS